MRTKQALRNELSGYLQRVVKPKGFFHQYFFKRILPLLIDAIMFWLQREGYLIEVEANTRTNV